MVIYDGNRNPDRRLSKMSYEQYMKHSKNHRKDKYHQQCSGYTNFARRSDVETMSNQANLRLETESMKKILQAKHTFPIYITQSGYYWCVVPDTHYFGIRINNTDELMRFIKDCTDINIDEYIIS